MLAGSHHLGRVDHFLMGDQSGADPDRFLLPIFFGPICLDLDRVELAKKFGCEYLYVEMEPGDALFFHSNLLHTRLPKTPRFIL